MNLPFRAGHYEAAALLGRGGMGVVYRATDTRTGTTVALKSLPSADPAALMRFKQEFRSLADISHPNLAALFELFAVDEAWWLAMECVEGTDFLWYVRGESLRPEPSSSSDNEQTSEVTIAHGAGGLAGRFAPGAAPLGPDQVARLRATMSDLASALYELHANDTLHRDVKPSNVMVDCGGRTVLLDFGLATALSGSRGNEGSGLFGTVSYMAPEQAVGRALTPAADWYAVGVMLYEALVGRLPFSGPSGDVIVRKLAEAPPLPRTLCPELPSDLCDLCEALLATNPARRPGGREVLTRLGVPEREARQRGDELMVGREAHKQSLRAALDQVRRGKPASVFVEGQSGAGKSHLVRHFLAEARALPSAVVLSGRCYEDESVPYKAVDSLIDALARFLAGLGQHERSAFAPRDAGALGRLFPVLGELVGPPNRAEAGPDVPDPLELRRRAFRSLRELLARIGDRRPLVLHVDDLQWGDADSAALLADLMRPPDTPVLLLLGVYRSEYADQSVCLRTLQDAYQTFPGPAAVTVSLGPLDEASAMELAGALLPPGLADAGTRAARIVQESGGIPFFIHELARHAAGNFATETSAADLDHVISRRARELPPAAREVLEMVSVCGHPITRQALAAATGHVDRGVLRQLRTAHFIRTTGADDSDWVEPYHDRIREAIARSLDAEVTRSYHGRLAEHLERLDAADAETLAAHFDSGGVPEKAGAYYARAADNAADALAFDHAAKLYARALELHAANGAGATRLRARLADALANSGRGPDAAREYLAAAAASNAADAVDLQRKAAYQYCVSGHLADGRAVLARLLGSIQVAMPEHRATVIVRLLVQRARLRLRGLRFTSRPASTIDPKVLLESDLTWAASAGLSMFDILAGAEFQSRNLYHALNAGEPARIARALAWEAAHTSNAGARAWPRTSRLLAAARTIASQIDDPHARGMTAMSEGIAEFTMGRWQSARDRLVQASDALQSGCRGVAWELDTAHTFELWARVYMGDFAAMTARTGRLIKEAEERGDRYAVTNFASFMVPHEHLVAGDTAAAAAAVDHALQLWDLDGYHLQHMTALMMRVYIDLYRGDGQAALDRLAARRGWVRAGFFTTIQVLRIVMLSLEGRAALTAAATSRDRSRLRAVIARAAGRIENERVSWAQPMARVLRAGLAALDGRNDAAVALLEQAASEFDDVPMDGYAAAARWRAARLLGRDGRAGALAEAGGAWFKRESVADPERMTAMLISGAA